MKAKEVFYMLGLRPKPRVYGSRVVAFDLPREGRVEYAQWLHPRESPKTVSQAVVDQLRTFLSPGDVAVDIGAHSGDSTLPMALAVGPQGCVLAFEPNRYVFPVLERNAGLNPQRTNIAPLMYAVTERDGPLQFEYSDEGFCNGGCHRGISKWRHGHAFRLQVEGRNLPALLERDYPGLVDRIRFIKIDAEGYDGAIVASLSELIARQKPYLMAEVFRKTNLAQRQALYEAIVRHGYEVYRVESEANYRGEPVGPGDLLRWPHFDVFCAPTRS